MHERSLQSDFLIALLRDLLATRRQQLQQWREQQQQQQGQGQQQGRGGVPPPPAPLKVVLMSATLDAALFSGYFGGAARCPGGCSGRGVWCAQRDLRWALCFHFALIARLLVCTGILGQGSCMLAASMPEGCSRHGPTCTGTGRKRLRWLLQAPLAASTGRFTTGTRWRPGVACRRATV